MIREKKVEQARWLALQALMEGMHFHEVAMSDPFKAEDDFLNLCKGILDCLGPPENVTIESFGPLRPLREVVAELDEAGL